MPKISSISRENIVTNINVAEQKMQGVMQGSSCTWGQLAKAGAILALSTGGYALLRVTGIGNKVARWLGNWVVGVDGNPASNNCEAPSSEIKKLDDVGLVMQEAQSWSFAKSDLRIANIDPTTSLTAFSSYMLCGVGVGLNALSMTISQNFNQLLLGTSALWCVSPALSQVAWQSPINFGSLNGVNGFKLVGEKAGDISGYSLSGAGDINGDRINDIIIGAVYASPDGRTNAGRSYVVFGHNSSWVWDNPLNLTRLNGMNGFKLDGELASDVFGTSVSGVGDINGDHIDDVIISAPKASIEGKVRVGRSYVIFGHNSSWVWDNPINLTTLNGINGFKLDGEAAGDISGFSVSGAGDINGDFIDDIIISAPWAISDGKNWAGRSYVIFGHNSSWIWNNHLNLTTLNGINGFKLDGEVAYGISGYSVSGAGDINGDHIDDIIIGAYSASPRGRTNAGRSYVVFGHNSNWVWDNLLNLTSLNGINGFKLDGEAAGDNSGYFVSRAGDVNGDRIDDIIIGAHGASPDGRAKAGRSYVIFGHNTKWVWSNPVDLMTLDGINGFKLDGEVGGDNSGFSVSQAGDINGDYIDDIIIGAPGASPEGRRQAGRSYVVFGHNDSLVWSNPFDLITLNGINGFKLDGEVTYDMSSLSISGTGDINGDYIDDIIISAPGASPEGKSEAGLSYVIFGEIVTNSKLKIGTLISSQLGCCAVGIGQLYKFTFVAGSFTGVNGALTYTVTQAMTKGDDIALPTWLSFNTANRTFLGTPLSAADIGCLNLKVVATTNRFASVSQIFSLNITQTLSAENIAQVISYIENTDYTLTSIVITTPSSMATVDLTLSDVRAGALMVSTSGNVTSTYNTTIGLWRAKGNKENVNILLQNLIFRPAANSYKNFYIEVNIADSYGQSLNSIINMMGIGKNMSISVLVGGIVGSVGATALVSTVAALAIYHYKKKKERGLEIEMAEPKSWYFDLSLKPLLNVSESYRLIPAEKIDSKKVAEFYQRCPVPGMDIKSVEIIYNPSLEQGFEAHVKALNEREGNPAFVPRWSRESNIALRGLFIERIRQMVEPYKEVKYEAASLVPMWYGADFEVLGSIFNTGCQVNEGFLGKGFYSTYEAQYAYNVYSKGTLLVNWVSFYSVYPVVYGDMVKLQGKGNYANYDAHFAPVSPVSSSPNEIDFSPCSDIQRAAYHVLLVFESAQCLPRYLVQLQPSLPKSVDISVASDDDEDTRKVKEVTDLTKTALKLAGNSHGFFAPIKQQPVVQASAPIVPLTKS